MALDNSFISLPGMLFMLPGIVFLLFNGVEEVNIISKVPLTLELSLESLKLFINSSAYDQHLSMYVLSDKSLSLYVKIFLLVCSVFIIQ